MREYSQGELESIIRNDSFKNEFCKTLIKNAEKEKIRIYELLEKLPNNIKWDIECRIYDIQYEMKKPKNIEEYANIEFVGIHEEHWALCSSIIILKINDQEIEFDNILSSGGYVSWGDEDVVEHGPWTINDLPEYLEKYEEEITKIINKNISWGCCGGCI